MSVRGGRLWGRTVTGDAGVGRLGEGWAEGAGLGWGSAVAGVEGRAAEGNRSGEHRRGSGRGVQAWGSLKRKVCAERALPGAVPGTVRAEECAQ